MGSFLSIQCKEKRRSSNRLSKPPQNQAASTAPKLQSPLQPAAQHALPLSTSAVWRNPWTGTPVPVSPSDTVDPSGRSQSPSSRPPQCDPARVPVNENYVARSPQGTTELWLPSPTSPTLSRQGSLYRRASFNPSKPVTFQPTTLQTNPQSSLTRQPKRSYSVHSPPHRPRGSVRRSPFTEPPSPSTRSRPDCQAFPPTRRRSLLTRPGVATRTSTKDAAPGRPPEPCRNGTFSPSPHHVFSATAQPPFLVFEDGLFDSSISPSLLRPSTPSDSEYTHLGALKLGSLRVVNGSASPCPSDRTRLNHTGSPAPEASESVDPEEHLVTAEAGNRTYRMSRSMSHDDLKAYMIDETKEVGAADCLPCGPEMSQNQGILPSHSLPASTTLNIPAFPPVGDSADFPVSPFSFEQSPTYVAPRMMELQETVDEAISISEEDRAPAPLPPRAPERNLSNKSYTPSHRKVDSGYSSAASVRSLQDNRRRTSMESYTSPQRSPGFRRFSLGGDSRDFEMYDLRTSSKFGDQLPMNRHLSLQGHKTGLRPELRVWPTSSTFTMSHDPQQVQVNGRLRSSSFTVAEGSSRMRSLPLYCAQLRSSDLLSPSTPEANTDEPQRTNEYLYTPYAYGDFSAPYAAYTTHMAPMAYEPGEDLHQKAAASGLSAISSFDNSAMEYYQRQDASGGYRANLEENSPGEHSLGDAGAVMVADVQIPMPGNDMFSPPASGKLEGTVEPTALEPIRGRARGRIVEYQHRTSCTQQYPQVHA